eukprot:jgi/Picre1/32071/NNA_007419.t1
MLDASCFKVHWRLWAVPAPHPLGVTTLSAAWNRLENLKKAIKPSVNQSYSLSMMRIEDIDDDKGHHEPPSRVQYDDYAMRDEELAKQLDAELNQRRRGRRAREETDSGRGKRPDLLSIYETYLQNTMERTTSRHQNQMNHHPAMILAAAAAQQL